MGSGLASTPPTVGVPRGEAHIVWRNLYRLGVDLPDLPDAFRDVYEAMTVSATRYAEASTNKLVLYRYCARVALAYHARRTRQSDAPFPEVSARAGWRQRGVSIRDSQRVLESLGSKNRAVLVMFEVEGMSCYEIAEVLEEPPGDVHATLMAARVELEDALHRWRSREVAT